MRTAPQEAIALSLSFSAYAGESEQNPTAAIQAVLELLEPYIGTFRTVWGPAWHTASALDDALAYIVQNAANPAEYYLIIRGTNTRSLSSWLWQDLAVDQLIEWSSVPQDPEHLSGAPPGAAAIAKGTNLGLDLLLNRMTIPDQLPPLFTFLQDLAAANCQQIILNVTGHSLGGALAPTLALWLSDRWPAEADAPLRPDIYAWSFASPAIGNREFAQYADACLGTKYTSYSNPLDIVPHAWNTDTLLKIPSLYSPLVMPVYLKAAWTLLLALTLEKNYTPCGNIRIVPSSLETTISRWTEQMDYQHIQPYLSLLTPTGMPPSVIDELIERKSTAMLAKLARRAYSETAAQPTPPSTEAIP
ncbi:MAG: hypothetical protein P4N59_32040 [Negativicutes bacterium]|nr:hypothetical protein [Negativicutes bacterium]